MTADNPFAPAYSRQSFLETLAVKEALLRLDEGLGAREPFLLLIGEPGTGKTALVHEAAARWESRTTVAVLAGPALSGTELLEETVLRLGGQPPEGASRPRLMACFEHTLADIAEQGGSAMLVIDDAHLVSRECLEELRLLVNAAQQARQRLEVLLVGLPALEVLLEDPALASVRQRVSMRVRLEPLAVGETRRYIRHRVGAVGGDGGNLFSRKTCVRIAELSRGVPRQINALAGAALRLARTANSGEVHTEHVQAAAAALWGAIPTVAVAESDEDLEVREATDVPGATVEAAATRRTTAGPVKEPGQETPSAPDGETERPHGPRPSHDAREWVARFIGDDGPIQIGLRAETASNRGVESPEPTESSSEPPAETSWGSSRAAVVSSFERIGRGRRQALTASLAAILMLTAVVSVIRIGSRGDAGGRGASARVTAAPHSIVGEQTSATPGPDRQAVGSETRVAETTLPERARTGRPPVSPTGRYTLLVGERRDMYAAADERDRMRSLTGFKGWVIPAPDGSPEPHRVVVGVYRSYARARAAADMLVRSRTLEQVTVVPLPPRSRRY